MNEEYPRRYTANRWFLNALSDGKFIKALEYYELYKDKIDPNFQTSPNTFALHSCFVDYTNIEQIEILLGLGADPNYKIIKFMCSYGCEGQTVPEFAKNYRRIPDDHIAMKLVKGEVKPRDPLALLNELAHKEKLEHNLSTNKPCGQNKARFFKPS